MNKSEKRYLVYRKWNGQIHAEIQYGEHTTGEDKHKDAEEIKRVLLDNFDLTLTDAIKLYPLEKVN